jgi:hypothetical protein
MFIFKHSFFMLYQIVSSLLILPCLLGFGSFLCNKLGFRWQEISHKMILGLLALSISWTLLSFFFPLTIYTEVFSLVLGYYFLYKTKAWEEGIILFKNKNWGLYFCILLVLFSSSFFPFILDYFGYYLPSVMWISQFGLVKGIANLDLTLGQMSFWHILQAGFSHISDLYLRINSWFLIIFILYIFEKKNWVLLLFVPLFLLFTQSPSPDLPMMVYDYLAIQNGTKFRQKNMMLLICWEIQWRCRLWNL